MITHFCLLSPCVTSLSEMNTLMLPGHCRDGAESGLVSNMG